MLRFIFYLFIVFASISYAKAQIIATEVTPYPSETFSYDGKIMYHYGVKWAGDSWAPNSGATAWLSGFDGIKFFSNGGPRMVIDVNGNVGIGTTSPAHRLTVNGDAQFGNNPINFTSAWSGSPDIVNNASEISNDVINYKRLMIVGNRSGGLDRRVGIWDKLDISGAGFHQTLNVNGGTYISGNVGIGTTSPAEKLSVNGKIRAKEIKVENANWPDYVFKEDYKLKPLSQVEAYIKQHNHLEDVPSAAVVAKEGMELGANQAVLLKKIEELTLHLIEMEKENNDLKRRIEKIENKK